MSVSTPAIRYWFEMSDQDLFYPNPTIPDGMHDRTLSVDLMAKLATDKGYRYQYLFACNARHVDRRSVGSGTAGAATRRGAIRLDRRRHGQSRDEAAAALSGRTRHVVEPP